MELASAIAYGEGSTREEALKDAYVTLNYLLDNLETAFIKVSMCNPMMLVSSRAWSQPPLLCCSARMRFAVRINRTLLHYATADLLRCAAVLVGSPVACTPCRSLCSTPASPPWCASWTPGSAQSSVPQGIIVCTPARIGEQHAHTARQGRRQCWRWLIALVGASRTGGGWRSASRLAGQVSADHRAHNLLWFLCAGVRGAPARRGPVSSAT